MKRKKGGGGGGANWMDTYGDMVTLLLCFFVLLYSMSTISEQNWKALVMSFNPDAVETVTDPEGNDGPNADPNEDDGSGLGITQAEIDNDIESLFEALQGYVNDQGLQNDVSVSKGDGKVFVTFNSVVFFDGNDSRLREDGKPILETMGNILSRVDKSVDEVRVMGHTAQAIPNQPNEVMGDRALAAMRSSNALAYIQLHCSVDPARMISEGYGQWRPVSNNQNETERAKNRRIEMIVSGRNLEEELKDDITKYDANK